MRAQEPQHGAQADRTLAFAVIGDAHVGNPPERFEAAVSLCNELPVDFVLLMGDFAHRVQRAHVDEFIRQLRRLEKPMYLVSGNHENRPQERDAGLDFGRELRAAFPGPWHESFTYGFECSGWRFITLGPIHHLLTGLENFYINHYKGFVNRNGAILHILPDDLRRFGRLLEETGDAPACVVLHVPVAPIADRLHERGVGDQCRLIQQPQIRSMIQSRPNVRVVLSAHHHMNQVTELRGQLHCITQNISGNPSGLAPGPAIRLMEFTPTEVRGTLIWHDTPAAPSTEVGTLQADRSFRWELER